MRQKVLHTIEHTQDGLTIKGTQVYSPTYNGGHYSYVVTNGAGHVIHVGQTSGGPPKGKLTLEDLAEDLKRASKWWGAEDRGLYLSPSAIEG